MFNNSVTGKPSREEIVRINHLYDKEFPEARLSQFAPSFTKSGKSMYHSSDDYTQEERRDFPLATYDSLAKKYYPVTLSALFEEEKLKSQLSRSQCMSAPAAGRRHAYTRARSALQNLRQSAEAEKYHKYKSRKFEMIDRNDAEKFYLMSSEAPTIGNYSQLNC